jgi:hypothetical protein
VNFASGADRLLLSSGDVGGGSANFSRVLYEVAANGEADAFRVRMERGSSGGIIIGGGGGGGGGGGDNMRQRWKLSWRWCWYAGALLVRDCWWLLVVLAMERSPSEGARRNWWRR